MSKTDDEYKEFKDAAKNFKYVIESNSPSWMSHWFNKLLYHPGTPYFFLGMGFEALGLAIQFLFQGSSYPVLDVIVAFLCGYVILYYHKKNPGRVTSAQSDKD